MLTPSNEKQIDEAARGFNTKAGVKSHADVLLDERMKVAQELRDELLVSAVNGQQRAAAETWFNREVANISLYMKLKKSQG